MTARGSTAERLPVDLRECVVSTALPSLAEGVLAADDDADPTRETLDSVHRAAVACTCHLLSALAADSGARSLARECHERDSFPGGSTDEHGLWSRLRRRVEAGEAGSVVRLDAAGIAVGPLADASLGPALAALPADGADPVAIGALYESLLATELVATDDGVELVDRAADRKAAGAFYTPDWVVDHLLERTLDPALAATEDPLSVRVADVACGAGRFLVGALGHVADHLTAGEGGYDRTATATEGRPDLATLRARADGTPSDRDLALWLAARHCLYGVDADPLAAELARHAVRRRAAVDGLAAALPDDHVVAGDSLAGVARLDRAAETLGSDPAHLCDRDAATRRRLDACAAARVADVETRALLESGGSDLEAAVGRLPATPVHFPLAFPDAFADGGFDVVVGNPPWEEATVEADEFWMRYAPGLQGRDQADQERTKRRLREERPDLVARLERERDEQARRRRLISNLPYPGLGTGDPETYKAFAWRCWDLLADGGHLGLVLPRTAFVAAGSEALRREFLEADVADLTFLANNRNWVFPGVHARYSIALLSVARREPTEATLPLRGPYTDREAYDEGMRRDPHRFSLSRARSWTGTAAFPLLPPDDDAVGAFGRLAAHPPLAAGADREGWHARPHAELHATNDKVTDDGTRLMHFENPPPDAWPVYKGSSFDHWEVDTGDRYAYADPAVIRERLQVRRERSYRYAGSRSAFAAFAESWVTDPSTLPCLSPRIAFRDVTNRTNRRTVIAALIPPETVLTNKAPYLLWPEGDERDQAYLLGVLCSLPLDWYARRFVETNLNYHVLNALPVPRPGREDPRRRRVEDLAGRLAAADERFGAWADAVGVRVGGLAGTAREAATAELDAVVARLYGLTRADLRVVHRTFHETWDPTDRLERVLTHYDRYAEG